MAPASHQGPSLVGVTAAFEKRDANGVAPETGTVARDGCFRREQASRSCSACVAESSDAVIAIPPVV